MLEVGIGSLTGMSVKKHNTNLDCSQYMQETCILYQLQHKIGI